MRIALIDPSLFTLPYDVALAGGLKHAGCAVTLHSRPPQPLDGTVHNIDLASHFYPLSESMFARKLPKNLRLAIKGIDHFCSMRRLLSRLRAEKPDIIHFQWLPLPLIDSRLLGRFRRIAPLVLTVHDTDPFNGDPAARLQRFGVDRALRAVDRLIVHTTQGRDRLVAQGIVGEKIEILPHGSLSQARAGAGDAMQGVLTLLLFGKIKPYKGADLLIEAFAALPPELRAQARIRIVGKPYMNLDNLRAQSAALGVTNAVSIEPDFIADEAIDSQFGPGTIALFPYREIEASGVLSYAIANGRPIIASNIGGFAETLTDGVHGRLVPVADVPALTDAIAELLTDRSRTLIFANEVASLSKSTPNWNEIGVRTSQVYALLTEKSWTKNTQSQPIFSQTQDMNRA